MSSRASVGLGVGFLASSWLMSCGDAAIKWVTITGSIMQWDKLLTGSKLEILRAFDRQAPRLTSLISALISDLAVRPRSMPYRESRSAA